ncbi:MAG: DUF3800 domain-containing protein [Candidatus Levybacteria bacterium]|nr:DUF3800 domain-containing protein [Candidatus Levybacteria bacterium]
MALVIFDDPLVAEETALAIKKLRRKLKFPDDVEFKYHKSRYEIKKQFLETCSPFRFKIRAIVVKKNAIYSNFLRKDTDSFFNYIVMQVLRNSRKSIKHAKLKFDKRGEKRIRDELRTYLSRQLDNKHKDIFTDLKFVDSRENVLIQLADMVAGCVASYHKGEDVELFKILSRRVDDIWEFK